MAEQEINFEYGYSINKADLEMQLARIQNSWRHKLGLVFLKIAEWVFSNGIKVKIKATRKEEGK